MADGASSISVTVRVRPFTIREAAQLTKCDDGTLFLGEGALAAAPTPKLTSKGLHSVIKVVDDKCLIFDPPQDTAVQKFSRHAPSRMGKRVKDQTFGFDRVFDDNATQDDIYTATTRPLLDNVMDGYNATVFAYGATGCGKTHTITGTQASPGIIFLTMQELFDKIQERSDEKQTEVSLSYMEIYNETIRDLLVPGGSKQGLMLREDANQTVSVAGLSTHNPKNVQEVMEMVVNGNAWRTVSPTEANATSSRSHAVLQINLAQKDRNADINEPHTMATLSIIDLAGSERASATKNRGERLLEGANINKSLLALGSCINALCDPRKKNHVPYRNSKLTRLLKFSLGGNCKTVMIVCVSPSSAHFDETQNTLRYANRAKNIQTKVTRNVYNVNRHVKDFLIKIDEQMALINELKAQQKDSEGYAFAKFKKLSDKRDQIAKEGIVRMRAAYEISLSERNDHLSSMKKLRQVENRISLLSVWLAAFDSVCEKREGEMPANLAATRKTAEGIRLELEGSRQHLHQRLTKNNWERAMDSALQNSIRQLLEADAPQDGGDVTSLNREAEYLKANAAREALQEILDAEKGGEAGIMQVLLTAHLDAISCVNDILVMTEADAIVNARKVLTRIFNSSTAAASQAVKPDGSLAITQAFPPTKRGTPKKKRPVMTESETQKAPVMAPLREAFTYDRPASPSKASPRRRKAPLAKGLSATPKKRSPSKRGVRWRDDADAGSSIADFSATPQKILFTPSPGGNETTQDETVLPPHIPAYLDAVIDTQETRDSSPLPPAPESTADLGSKKNRFSAGFLTKKAGSTPPPSLTSNLNDDDTTPLRSLDISHTSNRPSLTRLDHESGTNSSSESDDTPSWAAVDKRDKSSINTALKRASLSSRKSHGLSTPASRPSTIRRTSVSHTKLRNIGPGSPNGAENQALFTAGHARRMVRSEKEVGDGGKRERDVLSPRTQPVVKGSVRRGTISESRLGSGGVERRVGSSGSSNGTSSAMAVRGRESVAGVGGTGKGVWRG